MPLSTLKFLRPVFALALLCTLTLSACVTTGLPGTPAQDKPATAPAPDARTQPLRVTMLIPLSGKDALLGESIQNAATLALTDRGYNTFELLFEDTNQGGAAAAATRALQSKSDLLLGPIFANDVRAVRSVAAQAHIPVVAFSTDSSTAGTGTYLIGILPGTQAQRIGAFAGERHLRSVLVIAPRDAYGQLTAQAFIAAAQAQGVGIVGPFWLDQNEALLSTRLNALIAAGSSSGPVDGVFMPLAPDRTSKILQIITPLFAPQQTRPLLLGTGLWDDANMVIYPLLEGGYYAAPPHESRRRFEQIYTRQFGQTPPRLSALAYDSVALALTLGASEGKAGLTQTGLTRASGFSGINGLFRFLPDGRSERRLPVLQLKPGAAMMVSPPEASF